MSVTIKDIAKKSGCSVSTVSRVLNDSPFVNANTRLKVQQVIQDLGFKPNHFARGLAKGRMNIVACLIGDRWNPFYAELFSAAEEVLNEANYLAVLCYTDYDSAKEERYLEAARQYNYAGIIMVTAPETPQLVEALAKLSCPVALANRYIKSFPTDVVLMDNYRGAYIATRHLIDLGHSRIAHLSGPKNSTASRDRLQGYRDAMQEAGLEVHANQVFTANLLQEEGYKFGHLLLDKPGSVTAVFCGNDMMASGLVRAYRERGKNIPDDLSIVGFDDSPLAVHGPVKLTTVRQYPKEMGRAAAETILKRVEDPGQPYRRVIFAPELIVRDSAAPYKG